MLGSRGQDLPVFPVMALVKISVSPTKSFIGEGNDEQKTAEKADCQRKILLSVKKYAIRFIVKYPEQ